MAEPEDDPSPLLPEPEYEDPGRKPTVVVVPLPVSVRPHHETAIETARRIAAIRMILEAVSRAPFAEDAGAICAGPTSCRVTEAGPNDGGGD